MQKTNYNYDKTMKRFHISLLAAASLLMSSCSGFLKEYSQDLVYANNCTDLMELMIGSAYYRGAYNAADPNPFPYLFIMDDDTGQLVFGTGTADFSDDFAGYYHWRENPNMGSNGAMYTDVAWKDLYARIAVVNTVIHKVDQYPGDPMRLQVKGEAHFLRACYYYLLVNIYAQPYSAATAHSTPGVPLKTTPEIDGRKYGRNSLAEVYGQIVSDLDVAVESLDRVDKPSVYHADKNAAKAFLSRIFLYMGEWAKAEALCREVAGSGRYSYLDLNTTSVAPGRGHIYMQSPEMIFSFFYTNYFEFILSSYNTGAAQHGGFAGYFASSELITAYEANDLRFGRYIGKGGYGTSTFYPIPQKNPSTVEKSPIRTPFNEVFSLRFSEVCLNMAEAIAMQGGRDAEAIALLDDLRRNRYANRVATPIALSGEGLVNYIRDERRRELCFEGQRWFDIRRYAVSPKYPASREIRHQVMGENNQLMGHYILKPYDQDKDAYVLPIPPKDVLYSEGLMVQNPRRDREMVE